MSELRDWREDAGVKVAAAALDAVAAEVAGLEAEHVSVLAQVATLERTAGELLAVLSGGRGGSLSELNEAKRTLASARRRAEEIETASADAYARYADAERAVSEVSASARAAAWGPWLDAYRQAARELDIALAAAVDAEERTEELHRRGVQWFGGADRWVRAPAGDGRIGDASYLGRPLSKAAFASWREWVAEHVIGDASSKMRARVSRMASAMRQAVGVP